MDGHLLQNCSEEASYSDILGRFIPYMNDPSRRQASQELIGRIHSARLGLLITWCVCIFVFCAAVRNADANTWTNVAGGTFSEGGNWLEGTPPGETDIAAFNASSEGTYSVQFTGAATFKRVLIRFGGFKDVTFDLGGNDIVVNGTATAWNDAAIETRTTGTSDSYTLRLTNGTLTAGAVMLGAYNATVVTNQSILVVGDGATLMTTGAVNVARYGQHATIRVENGGRWEGHVAVNNSAYWMYLGDNPGCYGLVYVDGPSSEVDLNANGAQLQYVVVGEDGTGVIHVVNGGQFVGADDLVLGRTAADSYGVLWAEGTGSLIATAKDDISVGVNGHGLLKAEDGGRVESATSIIVHGDTVEIDNGTVAATNVIYFYSGSTYKLTLNDPDVSPMHSFGTTRLFQSGSGVTLDLALADDFQAEIGEVFVLFSYVSMTAGPFAGLPQDAEIELNDYTFQIDYGSGTDDQATLTVTAVPPKGTVISVR